MNKNQLKQLRFLYQEVNMIQEQINSLQMESAAVSASDKEWPYCKHTEIITGLPSLEDQRKRHQLERRKAKCQKQIGQIEYYIYHVEDSLIRQLLQYRYMEGLKWNEIAAKTGDKYSADYLRITLDNFLKRQ